MSRGTTSTHARAASRTLRERGRRNSCRDSAVPQTTLVRPFRATTATSLSERMYARAIRCERHFLGARAHLEMLVELGIFRVLVMHSLVARMLLQHHDVLLQVGLRRAAVLALLRVGHLALLNGHPHIRVALGEGVGAAQPRRADDVDLQHAHRRLRQARVWHQRHVDLVGVHHLLHGTRTVTEQHSMR